MTDEIPDSPVQRVEVEHEDGTKRVIEGPEAQTWVEWIGKSVAYMENHGGKVPDVEWEQHEPE